MANKVVHTELNTTDVGMAKKFYAALFDWKLEDMKMGPGMSYTMIKSGKDTFGGMQKKPMAEAPTMWLTYFSVDDLVKTVAKAKKMGAQIFVENQPIPGMGSLAVLADPTGAAIGLWQPEPKRTARRSTAKKGSAKRKS